MCFTEFIGYTCGHTSIEVLRPCPLTTQFHSNPICGTYGRRAILAQEMCPACQRILHGRAVLILEWEHHWMHERGVCGCPVIFPDLIKPRVIVPSHTYNSTQGLNRSMAVGKNTAEKSKNKTNGKAKVPQPKKAPANCSKNGGNKRKKRGPVPQGDSQSGGSKETAESTSTAIEVQKGPSQLGESQTAISKNPGVHENSHETQQGATTNQNIPAPIPARIHSLYGAEWIDEHRQLHDAGSCKCEADFSYYQTPEVYGISESSFLEEYGGQERAVLMGGPPYFPAPDYDDSQAWGQEPGYSNQPTHASQAHQSHDMQTGPQSQAYGQFQPCEPAFPTGQPIHPEQFSQPGAWSTGHQQPGLPANIGQPARSSGAIYQVDLTKSTNPLFNFACTEGGKQGGRMGRCVDMQNLEYIKPKDAPPPLVGLPIGAGPEAPDYMEHIGSFGDCQLNQSNKARMSQQKAPRGPQEATQPWETIQLQQTVQPDQADSNINGEVVVGLLESANDSPSSRLLRLTHRKSASSACNRLSWDGHLHDVHSGSDQAYAACSSDGSGMGGDDLN